MSENGNADPKINSAEELWKAIFNTYYDSFYNEVVADRVVNRWQIFDDATKIVIAVTAAGSAISGWALWNNPNFKWIWTIIASVSALAGIIQTSLQTSNRVNDWGEIKRAFAGLRIEFETLMYQMRFSEGEQVEKFGEIFITLRRKYLEAVQMIKNDIMLRDGLKLVAQEDVDKRLEQEKGASNGS